MPYEKDRKDFRMKGKWHDYFGNKNPLVLELGCGKGEYTVGLAEK
jgi:tRNA (guanine-N7-)-methyltransferase